MIDGEFEDDIDGEYEGACESERQGEFAAHLEGEGEGDSEGGYGCEGGGAGTYRRTTSSGTRPARRDNDNVGNEDSCGDSYADDESAGYASEGSD